MKEPTKCPECDAPFDYLNWDDETECVYYRCHKCPWSKAYWFEDLDFEELKD